MSPLSIVPLAYRLPARTFISKVLIESVWDESASVHFPNSTLLVYLTQAKEKTLIVPLHTPAAEGGSKYPLIISSSLSFCKNTASAQLTGANSPGSLQRQNTRSQPTIDMWFKEDLPCIRACIRGLELSTSKHLIGMTK